MATKTQEVFRSLNYFTAFKENGGGYCGAYSDALIGLSDIFSNQVASGLHTEAEIKEFEETLPGTSDIFDRAAMHPDLSLARSYFGEAVKVKMAALSQPSGIVR